MGLFNKNASTGNMVFDWDSYYADIERGISVREQNKKFKRFAYYTNEEVIKSRKNSFA